MSQWSRERRRRADSSDGSFPKKEHSLEMTVQQEKMDRDQSDMWEEGEKMGAILTEIIEKWIARELKQRRCRMVWEWAPQRAKGCNTAHRAYKERCGWQAGSACLWVQKDQYSIHLWIPMIRSSRAMRLKGQVCLSVETSEK